MPKLTKTRIYKCIKAAKLQMRVHKAENYL